MRSPRSLHKSNRGFTLVELIVTIVILVFMVTVVLANTHNLGLNARVKASANLIVDTLKDTRSKSISVRQFNNASFPSYGVHLETANPRTITVYADCVADDNADGTINNLDTFRFISSSTQCGGTKPNGLDQQISLDANTRITAISATYPVGGVDVTTSESVVDLEFLRPEPTIWISRGAGILIPVGKVEITVKDNGGKYQRKITFYSSGQFSIQ